MSNNPDKEPTRKLTPAGKAALEKISNPSAYPGSPDPRVDAKGFVAWFKKNVLGQK